MPKSFNNLPISIQAVFLSAAALALAAGVFFYGFPGVMDSVWSLSTKRDRLKKEIERLKRKNYEDEAFERNQPEYLERNQQLIKRTELLRIIVPDEPTTDQFMRMVRGAGTATGVHVRTLAAQARVARDFHDEMPFTVHVDGTYWSLFNFFNRLARMQRIVSVSGLSLGPPEGRVRGDYRISPSGPVGATCVVTSYFTRPPTPAPPRKN